MHNEETQIIDYTDAFPGCIAAQANGRNVIILRKIDPIVASRIRADGKRASYEIETRFLSRDARPDTDDYVCVEYGPDFEYWQAKELPKMHRVIKKGGEINLFELIRLYP
jgi:hypothetical protein